MGSRRILADLTPKQEVSGPNFKNRKLSKNHIRILLGNTVHLGFIRKKIELGAFPVSPAPCWEPGSFWSFIYRVNGCGWTTLSWDCGEVETHRQQKESQTEGTGRLGQCERDLFHNYLQSPKQSCYSQLHVLAFDLAVFSRDHHSSMKSDLSMKLKSRRAFSGTPRSFPLKSTSILALVHPTSISASVPGQYSCGLTILDPCLWVLWEQGHFPYYVCVPRDVRQGMFMELDWTGMGLNWIED